MSIENNYLFFLYQSMGYNLYQQSELLSDREVLAQYSGKSNNFSNTSSSFNYNPINGGCLHNEEIVFESALHEEDNKNKILLRDAKDERKNLEGKS